TIDLNRTRYLTLLGTIITQFALGSVYTWSLFNAQLSDKLDEPATQVGHGDDGDGVGGDHGRQAHHVLADVLGHADDVETAHAG
ncbi:hypothetical protein MRR68_22755, partial [Aeromonas dhakensis]|nr:hypothetical protein [Aeromonas dhakensis]